MGDPMVVMEVLNWENYLSTSKIVVKMRKAQNLTLSQPLLATVVALRKSWVSGQTFIWGAELWGISWRGISFKFKTLNSKHQ